MRDGEPVCQYVYDLAALEAHVKAVVAALPPRCRMFYAMKANSAAPLLRTLAPLVAGFEVASGGELAKARAVSADIEVLFGGPAKTRSEIAEALAAGVTRLHVESVLELHRISAEARLADTVSDVLLRVNLAGPFPDATLAMAGRPTQFGIEESGLAEAVAAVDALPNVRLAGFHLHSLSNNLSPEAHLAMLAMYRDRILAWEAAFGLRCEVINVGGGIGVDYADLEAQFAWPRFTKGLSDLVGTFPEHWEEIDFECGRYLVAGCGTYRTEVLDVKRNHGVNYVLVRGGTHHFRLPVSWQHSHPFSVRPVEDWDPGLPRQEIRGEPVTVVGELCTPKDVLAKDVLVDGVRPGDVLEFHYAGAYGWEISHHDFLSHPHPEHVHLCPPASPPPP
ncbi:diaminopimelate decarboxylase [Prauserella marina]|uniref:Diaminopimelate decarboxylase n=1 Tax=Prauserella marina TaxID=530584 RepID=A0A222VWK3_9PSEU|nr:type III PLP-dependent enzyme [Prauserella marina]ASR38308.1 diaminopimelate decarboxylase [Prauserella marina]PWV78483.1 diaminopimelate decarboxylase [Prauserella marina]SDC87040.1 diaminopimelate decarboxylase [Prauserella marina]